MSSRRARRLRSRLGRRFTRRFGWLVGAPLAIFRFLRRQTPLEELDPGGAPRALSLEEIDLAHHEAEQGAGPVINRLYRATIPDPKLTAERLLSIIAADLNVIAPWEVLRFEKTRGQTGGLHQGDELLIRMPGPWNGPVEITRRWGEGLRFAATRGHPQRGAVELRARDDDGEIVMEIQTRERAAGLTFHLVQRIGLIRRMQTYVWGEMLENAAQLAGGRRPDRITMQSWRR